MAPRPVLEKLNLCKQGADLCSSPVTQLFVAAYFEERAGTRGGRGGEQAAGGERGATDGGGRGSGGGGRGAAAAGASRCGWRTWSR